MLLTQLTVHVECANQKGFVLGFDITPVKASRKDQFNIVNIDGEAGTMTATIWCKDHAPSRGIVHKMHQIVDDQGLNALQLYVQNYKQADLTLTGTVRKANLVSQSTKAVTAHNVTTLPNRRVSTASLANGTSHTGRAQQALPSENDSSPVNKSKAAGGECLVGKVCATCGTNATPKWWPFPQDTSTKQAAEETSSEINVADGKPGGSGSSNSGADDDDPYFWPEDRVQDEICGTVQKRTWTPPQGYIRHNNNADILHHLHYHHVRGDQVLNFTDQQLFDYGIRDAADRRSLLQLAEILQKKSAEYQRLSGSRAESPNLKIQSSSSDVIHTNRSNEQTSVAAEDSAPDNVALAAAAFKENTKLAAGPKETQCHKCHFNKVQKPAPAPPPAPRSIPDNTPQAVVAVLSPAPAPPAAAPSPALPTHGPYPWAGSAAYSPPAHYSDWSRTTSVPPVAAQARPYTGSPSPHMTNVHHLNGHSHERQPVSTRPSPQQNGYPSTPSATGYPLASHHKTGPPSHLQNGLYGSYVTTRPPPHHLTNGGPAPRAPEHPFSQPPHPTSHHHQPFGVPQGSPPLPRDQGPPARASSSSQPTGARSAEGRVNGGASESPSLRNLLS
jgi:hypothetical protein